MICVACFEAEAVAEIEKDLAFCAFCFRSDLRRGLKSAGYDFDEWAMLVSDGTGKIPDGMIWRPERGAAVEHREENDSRQLPLFGSGAVSVLGSNGTVSARKTTMQTSGLSLRSGRESV
jgi:hypothetical protein